MEISLPTSKFRLTSADEILIGTADFTKNVVEFCFLRESGPRAGEREGYTYKITQGTRTI